MASERDFQLRKALGNSDNRDILVSQEGIAY